MRSRFIVVLVVVVVTVPLPAVSSAAGAIIGPYRPPVDAPVVDPFRPPTHPYGPGNRGIEYGTVAGDPVRAAGAGQVVFAGAVAGALHVTLLHPDGLRTTYSHLGVVTVRLGARVDAGRQLGIAGGHVHFGVRAGDRYLDPALLFGDAPSSVRLVPLEASRPGPVSEGMALWRGGPGSLWSHYLSPPIGVAMTSAMVSAVDEWWGRRDSCTAPDEPAGPPSPRTLVLVGGLGSSSSSASIDDLDVASLGLGADHVVRFSYAGGAVPGPGAQALGVGTSTYRSTDTQQLIDESASRLAALLADLVARDPRTPIGIVAHSQGGVVARLALDLVAADGPVGPVDHLVTLGSPHGGADLATAGAAFAADPRGRRGLGELADVFGVDLEAGAPALRDLAENSGVVRGLEMRARRGRAVPPGVTLTSIAARGDLVVPVPRTVVAGTESVVVPLVGLRAHSALPGHPVTTREVARALTDQPPTCEGLGDLLADRLTGQAVSSVETWFGAHAALVAAVPPP